MNQKQLKDIIIKNVNAIASFEGKEFHEISYQEYLELRKKLTKKNRE